MTDEEWDDFRREQERQSLTATIERSLGRVTPDEADRLREEFLGRLEAGGVDAVYAFAESIDGIRLPQLYPAISDQFVNSRVPSTPLTRGETRKLVRYQRKLAKKLRETGEIAIEMPDSLGWGTKLGESMLGLADDLIRRATETEESAISIRPGRAIKPGTQLALDLENLYWKPELPMTHRCKLIADVVSSFVEPVSAEQIRQRLKDLRPRPRQREERTRRGSGIEW